MTPKTPPALLYKYITPAGVRLLSSLSLRFSPPSVLNDPFESRLPVLTYLLEARNRLSISPGAQTLSQMIDQRYGISCFSEEAADLLMWAHYTNAHAGLVIGFKTTHHEFSELGQLFPVEYHTRRPTLKSSNSPDAILAALSTKSRDWEYEKEWRLVTELSSCTRKRGVYLKRLSPKLIEVVILGLRANAELRTRIVQWGRRHPTVHLRQARLDSLNFRLHFDENLKEETLIVMTNHEKKDPILSVPADPASPPFMLVEWSDGTMILRDITPRIMPSSGKARKNRRRSKKIDCGVFDAH